MSTVTCCRWRDDAHTRGAGKLIMDAYGRRGAGAGQIAHDIDADGTGAMVVADTDDAAEAYRTALEFAELMDLAASTTHVALTIDDALVHVADRLAG